MRTIIGRRCAGCDEMYPKNLYSNNQWSKGRGYSRCVYCANSYQCKECGRTFQNQNNLNMHMQTHRPKNKSCPICGVQKFRSGANIVQHVESGYCQCCPGGKQRARKEIYKFVYQKRPMRPYLTNDVPLLTYGYGSDDDDDVNVPDYPYYCPECNKYFRQLSQLLQHQDQKHNYNMRVPQLTY